MINAIVQNKQGETAVIDLTVHYHEIYKELQSLGYYGSPERLPLKDEEDEEYSVKLYSDSDIGNSMILLLNEKDSLYDAYLLDLAVTNSREETSNRIYCMGSIQPFQRYSKISIK